MEASIKKLLILASGGDAPGMNAATRAIVRTALQYGIEVFGCCCGYQGLVEHSIVPLSSPSVANIIQRGGTILKTGRCPAFLDKDTRDACRHYLRSLNIDAMVILGGNGSFRGALALENEGGPKVIGIPCTIDNDIVGTEYTIGFDTACNNALHAIDKIRDTAFSFNRNFLVEVMGGTSSFLAVDVGIAGGAEFILIPEITLSAQDLINKMQNRQREKLSSIIVVAEAGEPGRSLKIAQEIKDLSGIEYKVCILGYIQRGGSPSVKDRKLASIMGNYAVECLLQGKSQCMLAMKANKIIAIAFPDASSITRQFDENDLLRVNDYICDVKYN